MMEKFFRCIQRRYSVVPTTLNHPTIYALSTPPGQLSAVAVIRISGSCSRLIYSKLTRSLNQPVPRRASLRKLYGLKHNGELNLLDSAITLFFNHPQSFTGEDTLELHLHGGKAVVKSVLKAIESIHDRNSGINIRYAQPGEFSMRAFQNGRLDLTQIEGIGELISAETETQRKSALSSFNGENKIRFFNWRKQIITNIGQLAAIIDFGDDAEIEDIQIILDKVEKEIIELRKEVKNFICKIDKSSILQSGIKLVLFGPPNVGKSSLINIITDDETAIVSDIPGTTRDAIDISLDIDGYKVVLCDTAGIRLNTDDTIELQGIERAKKKSILSDLVILMIDPMIYPYLTHDIVTHVKSKLSKKEIIIVINKCDLINEKQLKLITANLNTLFENKYTIKPISCLTDEGIDSLKNHMTYIFQKISESSEESDPIIVSKRIQEILSNDILYGLDEFIKFKELDDVVMASESLNYAADGIGKITGEVVGIEEVLGVVFSNFCVGK